MQNSPSATRLPAVLQWTPAGRAIVFFLSATSIWCLLAELYNLCDMRTFTIWVLIPSSILLVAMAVVDKVKGDNRLYRAVMAGLIGVIASVAYDVFRLPFVLAFVNQSGPSWVRLPLFKVFPRFGAMILNKPFTGTTPDSQFSLWSHVLGWVYHFSNGITFAIMYLAIIGDASRRSWLWAIALAVFLELAMLFTPYPGFFGIRITPQFVVVTLTAHLIFGVVVGRYTLRKSGVRISAAGAF